MNVVVYAVSQARARNALCDALTARGERPYEASSEAELLRKCGEGIGGAVLIAASASDGEDVLRLTRHLRRAEPHCPVVLVARIISEDFIIAAFRAGASDLLRDSHSAAEAQFCLDRNFSSPTSPGKPVEPSAAREIIGGGPAMRQAREAIQAAARTELNVLITGETGTGKEVAAEQIHRQSRRRAHPFVCVNCAAIPPGLLESELFGHERGAFTGALAPRDGKLPFARGGTVFLDEIGDMDLYSQAKILRAIESRRVQRLGSNREIPLDIRIIAATNQNLEQLAAQGRFRQDLYYRLNVVRVHLPPLRERPEDLPALVERMLAELNSARGPLPVGIDPTLLAAMAEYSWPGNIRELRNCIESAFAFCPSDLITGEHLPPDFQEKLRMPPPVEGTERERVLHALTSAHWNKSEAARLLHWSRMTLYRKMTRHGIAREECNRESDAATA